MNEKNFKYESKNKKKIRLKDLLMLFSIFTLCIISILITNAVPDSLNKETARTEISLNSDTQPNSSIPEASLDDYTPKLNPKEEIAYEILPELSFGVPYNGEVLKLFSPNELIYSKTMDDWRIHTGIDIACPYGSDIKSVERGIVKDINYDINYGNTVTVETDEYTLVYTSLSSDILVSKGQKLSKGDIIAKSSDTCMSEICDEPHIHFEMKQNGEYVNPLHYLQFN